MYWISPNISLIGKDKNDISHQSDLKKKNDKNHFIELRDGRLSNSKGLYAIIKQVLYFLMVANAVLHKFAL